MLKYCPLCMPVVNLGLGQYRSQYRSLGKITSHTYVLFNLGLSQMKAVKDQKRKLERLSETFQVRFVKYITSKFIQQGNELSVTGELKLLFYCIVIDIR